MISTEHIFNNEIYSGNTVPAKIEKFCRYENILVMKGPRDVWQELLNRPEWCRGFVLERTGDSTRYNGAGSDFYGNLIFSSFEAPFATCHKVYEHFMQLYLHDYVE